MAVRSWVIGLAVGVAALLLSACGESEPTAREQVQAALCADLRDGASFAQLMVNGRDAGLSNRDMAVHLIVATDEICPEFREALFRTAIPEFMD